MSSALAQTAVAEVNRNAVKPQASQNPNPIRDRFREGMREYLGQLDQLSKDVDAVTKKLEKTESWRSMPCGRSC